jgi:hypothetical protein
VKLNSTRDDEAVSAAVATVLLFGGVVSIIGLMLVSMVPIIEELEGSIERGDMASQMMILAEQTESLSENGMPGDSAEVQLIPLDGSLEWDVSRGGMWYSATWQNESSFRMKGVMDFDDSIEIKHPESFTSAVCFDDLRLGPSRPFIYTPPQWAESAQIAISTGLAIPLGPVQVKITDDGEIIQTADLQIHESTSVDLTSIGSPEISSSHELVVIYSKGQGGAALLTPTKSSPTDNYGKTWNIPLDSGESRIHIFSEDSNQIQIESNSNSETYYAIDSQEFRTSVSFTHQFTLTQPDVIRITTSTLSQLILQTEVDNLSGSTSLISQDGNHLGHRFIAPSLEGKMEFSNPGSDSVTVTWRGGGTSIAALGTTSVAWPPAGINGAPMLDADGDIFATWKVSNQGNSGEGIHLIPAADTGASSGIQHEITIEDDGQVHSLSISRAGSSSGWNITGDSELEGSIDGQVQNVMQAISSGTFRMNITEGHPVKIHHLSGESGLTQAVHDGAQRCTSVNMMASGWITVELPWDSLSGQDDLKIRQAWKNGDFPASIMMTLIGHNGASTHSNLATSWVFHLSRLAYSFSSSITGMEVAYSGGAIVTNHPEFTPTIIREPVDRSGPGPRFAATIPSLHPVTEGVIGGGSLTLDIELTSRESLASDIAYEVRRGWSEPYGSAIASDSSDGLELSEDWAVYPGRLDLLTDYVGWVPDPSIGTSEAVWHTSGVPIQFSLQISSLDVLMQEVIG